MSNTNETPFEEFIIDRPEYIEYLEDEKIKKQLDICKQLEGGLLTLSMEFNKRGNLKMNLEEILKKNKIEFMKINEIYKEIYLQRKILLRVLEHLGVLINEKGGIEGEGWKRYSDEIRGIKNDYASSLFNKYLIL